MTWSLLLACAGPITEDSAVDSAGVDTTDSALPETERFVSIVDLPTESTLIDVRSVSEFDAGHLPGAVNVPWGDLRAEVDGISGQLASVHVVSDAFSQVGLAQDSAVVLYDGRSSRDAGRLAWTLQVSGHQGPVQILDGGWLQWQAQGLEVSTESPSLTTSDWQATAPSAEQAVDADWIFARLDDPTVVVVDVRSPAEFAEGRIPGALNVEWSESVHGQGVDVGTLLSESELLVLYEALPLDATIVVSCQSGARAGHSWAVLPTLGFQDVRLYDGAWNEWSSRDDLPVER